MTTDDFIAAADAAAEQDWEKWAHRLGIAHGNPQTGAFLDGHRAGFVWARDYLAQQRPTDDQLEAAVEAILARQGARHLHLEDVEAVWDIAQAALMAASEVR